MQVLADARYRSEDNFKALAGSGTALVVAMGRAYRMRKWTAEPLNGWFRRVLRFCQFSWRGHHRMQAEAKLMCLALNLRRMGSSKAG